MKKRDMTQKQFDAALAKRGFKIEGFLGYVKITDKVSVSTHNAPDQTRRGQLSYLCLQRRRVDAEQ